MGIPRYFDTKNYTWRLDIVQNLCVYCQFLLPDFLGSKCPTTPRPNFFIDTLNCILLINESSSENFI